MLFTTPIPFINAFVEQLDQGIKKHTANNNKLSTAQRYWLSFCLTGILLSNKVCWTSFEQVGLGGYTLAALSWMFKHTKLLWTLLLHVSISLVLEKYCITEAELVIDDSDRQRAKRTKRIFRTHKVFDKKTGGWFNGQSVVFLLLVTPKITIPVGFMFYQPDPLLTEWRKTDKVLKKRGVAKCKRPPKPRINPKYLSKLELSINLLQEFKHYHPSIWIKAILADALYGNAKFMNEAAKVFDKTQIISQLKKTQKVNFRCQEMTLEEYFDKYPGVKTKLRIRGGKEVDVVLGSARLYVKAHKQKRFVVALKYEGEEHYRYLVASDMSWRTIDIATAYTLRWLVEVFIEDWKLHEGWAQFAPQFDEDGSSKSLALSLLLDHALILHPEQQARIENKLPAYTVGSLQQKSRMDALLDVFRSVVDADDPHKRLDEIVEVAKRIFPLRDSRKHMNGMDLGRLEPTPALKHRAEAACMR